MKVTEIEVRRLVSLPGYGHRALEVRLALDEGDTYEQALAEADRLISCGLNRLEDLEAVATRIEEIKSDLARSEESLAQQAAELAGPRKELEELEAHRREVSQADISDDDITF